MCFEGAFTEHDVGVFATAGRHVFQRGCAAAGKCDLADHKQNECKSNRIFKLIAKATIERGK